MGINNIELQAVVIEELYHSSLFEESTISLMKKVVPSIVTKKIESTDNSKEWKSLGNNSKQILILVKNEVAVHLPDSELSFLTGILSACKLSLADVAIVNANNYPEAKYKELTSFFSSKIVLLFDIEPSTFGLPMSFPYYQIQSFTGNSYLYSPSLQSLENNKVEKSRLWVSLKRLFNL